LHVALSTLGLIGVIWGALLVIALVLIALYGERRHQLERRAGPDDRRRGLPDTRERPVERRVGPEDRRAGAGDRRAEPAEGSRRLPRLRRRGR
jgi:hypothetical protein